MLQVDNLQRPGGPLNFGPVTFQIERGECLALTGRSGAGKSLLLRAVADLDPNEGTVALGGEARAAMPATTWRRRVAYFPAEPGWWLEHVGEHMADRVAACEILARLGFADPDDVMSWPISRLSSGERQRIALARGLAGGREILLLDEPTSALDADSCALVEALLQQCLDDGVAILLVSHDPDQIARMARRRLHLEGGRLVAAP
ncbi:MAG: ATP-binding cassette domain-containing protein [Rhodospirillaceae bacterium]|jgi:ABC-type iron transport system FetAB ATPase subunit|nr:ATP-binding cassette domain-containing protein [Rhodospirillaceae bacterium]MBT4688299.1 ATP-binding cassette domain-containing protein [Rhodospirillaceae bacterium]MBT5080011.1 ATP-binding cassette domain-containing protein [Rhodospirillaceae bacterium]MBT5525600.1 ATP-binding cassette domain-containing protein [Rhodospirillaceae bacterium]MBT5880359.1 ATP-binding cassette domain-containing protein [Rhodospirillaceae bacterium]